MELQIFDLTTADLPSPSSADIQMPRGQCAGGELFIRRAIGRHTIALLQRRYAQRPVFGADAIHRRHDAPEIPGLIDKKMEANPYSISFRCHHQQRSYCKKLIKAAPVRTQDRFSSIDESEVSTAY